MLKSRVCIWRKIVKYSFLYFRFVTNRLPFHNLYCFLCSFPTWKLLSRSYLSLQCLMANQFYIRTQNIFFLKTFILILTKKLSFTVNLWIFLRALIDNVFQLPPKRQRLVAQSSMSFYEIKQTMVIKGSNIYSIYCKGKIHIVSLIV